VGRRNYQFASLMLHDCATERDRQTNDGEHGALVALMHTHTHTHTIVAVTNRDSAAPSTVSRRQCIGSNGVTNRGWGRLGAVAPGRSRRGGAKLSLPKYFMTSEPKLAYCNTLEPFLLPAYLGISYFTAHRFYFQASCTPPPPKKNEGGASLFLPQAPRTLLSRR